MVVSGTFVMTEIRSETSWTEWNQILFTVHPTPVVDLSTGEMTEQQFSNEVGGAAPAIITDIYHTADNAWKPGLH